MNLSERFYQYLTDNQIAEFSSTEAFNWYASQKKGSGPPDYSNLHGLVLKPLIHQGLIKKVLYHSYIVLTPTLTQPFETARTLKEEIPISDEDKEFFEYLQSKIKG